MFYFINSDNRHQYRDQLQDAFSKLAIYYGSLALDDYDTQDATYVIGDHPVYGILGGLRLLPTQGPTLSDESLAESGIALHDSQTWEATKVFFHLDLDNLSEDEEAAIQQQFYQDLLSFLHEKCAMEMLVSLLPEAEHNKTRDAGLWPYMLEFTVRNPYDADSEDYVLGVLQLNELGQQKAA